jgi:hypothetical protein
MKSKLVDCVIEGLLQLHEELSVDPEAPWYVGKPDQTQVLHQELWTLAAEVNPGSSGALVACTGELVSSRHVVA